MTPRRILLSALVLAILAILGWHQIHASSEWRNFSWQAVWTATRGVNVLFVVGAIVLIYLSYLLRSLRWRTLMVPHGRLWPVLKGTLIGFTGIAFFGRPGELVRPYYIARKHATSISPQLAVWLLERAFDMGATLVLVGAALLFSPDLIQAAPNEAAVDALRRAIWVLAPLTIVALASIALFHRYSQRFIRYAKARLERSSHVLARRVDHFLRTLASGTQALTRRSNLLLSALYTLGLWLGVAVAVWLIVRCYPGMLPGFGYTEALILLGFLLVGSIVQLPAIGGGVQVLVLLGLTEFFGAPAAPAASAALLLWLISFYAVTPLGAALAAREGISWRTFEHEAELAGS